MSTNTVRPTKKQRELLTYIEQFIEEHGYSPSYREIMNGLSYTSVATVSLHVTSLIRRGHLRKRDRSARSLEVVKNTEAAESDTTEGSAAAHYAWFEAEVEKRFVAAEDAGSVEDLTLQGLQALVTSLELLGSEQVAAAFSVRLTSLTASVTETV